MSTRQEICQSAYQKLAQAQPKKFKTLIGLDGFVDSIIAVVDKRHSATQYEPVKMIADFGQKIVAAGGESSNYEFVITMQKLGGNGPIMANALASIGFDVTYIGSLGYPAIHPVFAEMATRAEVISIAEPGYTDAVEFEDGKLMFGKYQTLDDVNWTNLIERIGAEKLIDFMNQSDLIGMVNWTMLGNMTDIWQHLYNDLLPRLNVRRRLFVDLADPEKRTLGDKRAALDTIAKFQKYADVTLGLNLKEALQINEALGLKARGDKPEAVIEELARDIRAQLKIDTVVIHPRRGAAAANAQESAAFAGPFVQQPKLSTGAGDNFNAGFVTGQLLGLPLIECLCAGTATSGYYVRNAASPSVAQLAEFIRNLPAPE